MSLSDSEPIDQLEDSDGFGGMFAHLAPVQEDKPIAVKRKIGGFNFLKKQNEKENKKNQKIGNNSKRREKQEERSRSRSRDRANAKRGSEQQQDNNMIVISDDDEQNDANYHNMSAFEYMNWRERRKLDRLFAREQRKYRQGKPKDQLSFKIFNTIQQYFR